MSEAIPFSLATHVYAGFAYRHGGDVIEYLRGTGELAAGAITGDSEIFNSEIIDSYLTVEVRTPVAPASVAISVVRIDSDAAAVLNTLTSWPAELELSGDGFSPFYVFNIGVYASGVDSVIESSSGTEVLCANVASALEEAA